MKSILLKCSGPLQSWGTDSSFETRKSDPHPSKSAMIGLISASLGLTRDDQTRISELNNLDFAVRIDQPGRLLRDYHTAHKYKPNGDLERTYVTNRYYIEDAVFVVGLGSDNAQLIDEVWEALHKPYFQQFLGRKSLPPTADFLIGLFNTGVVDAMKSLPWQAANWYINKNQKGSLVLYADADLVDSKMITRRRDSVASFSQKNRQFKFRSEARIQIDLSNDSSDEIQHDAFGALGDG